MDNINVISDARVRNIISKGPKYRFPLIGISLNVVEISLFHYVASVIIGVNE